MTDTSDVSQRIQALETRLDAALSALTRLQAVEAIRDAVLRCCRGLDRMDRDLMASAFHPDASVDYGAIFTGPVAQFLDTTMVHQARQREVQHLVGNILVRVEGDRAVAESYELARHKSPLNGEMVDLILAMRTLDRFECRDGQWRIAHRRKVVDWARTLAGSDQVYERSPLTKGTRDTGDASYPFFTSF
jgi:hypothetical protein